MLYRKIQKDIEEYFVNREDDRILLIDGARQIGKTFIIRYMGQNHFTNYVELNFVEDSVGSRLFAEVNTTEEFYFRLSMVAGNKLGSRDNTLIFFDEIQVYPQFLTLLKFLRDENKYKFIASGSMLGIALKKTTSIPIGSIKIKRMFPLDFEEFLLANGIGETAISRLHEKFLRCEGVEKAVHERILGLFKKYLLIGGLPAAVNVFLAENNIFKVREIQNEIRSFYGDDAAKYSENTKLKIKRIYEMIPSNLENKKKRVVIKDIENKKGKRVADYQDEFEYLISSGTALEVKAIANPVFPLLESAGKNLLKLYLNDVGILTAVLYQTNVQAVLDDKCSINLGTVYEAVVAEELSAHGHRLFYYDNRKKGEVDFLIDDYEDAAVVPIEVKSGKDYYIHSALNAFVSNGDYAVKKAVVLSNCAEVKKDGNVIYLPVYYVMFL